jgi:hypothetical protein
VTALREVGAQSAWFLDFRKGPEDEAERVLLVSSSDYYASIDATLPSGLDGGSYTFTIEGISNEHYRNLYLAAYAAKYADRALAVRFHLYWSDAGIRGYFVDLAGLTDTLLGDSPPPDSLVAVLSVTALKRRAGSRRYEVAVEAREWSYDRLLRRLSKGGKAATTVQAVRDIAADDNIKVHVVLVGDALAAEDESSERERSFTRGEVALDRLVQLGHAMERETKKFGLGMFLIDNNVIYAGPDRLSFGNQHDLSSDTGLIQIESRGQEPSDPNFVPQQLTDREPKRDQFELTLRGRPDIKPGDFVTFRRPAEETDDAGTLSELNVNVFDAVKLGAEATAYMRSVTHRQAYVRGVTHRLAREQGFVSILRGISIPEGEGPLAERAWFTYSPPKGPATTEPAVADDSPEGWLIGALRHLITGKSGGRRIDVAQVRAPNVKPGSKLPAQTEKLWRGLEADDGKAYGAARLAFDDKEMSRFETAPYASPFAWGKFGLVLPRYPGMRVLLAHRNGDADDLVDAGALWERGTAPASNPGDYWLILPAAIPQKDRERVTDDQKPSEPSGKATNDLIDADGNRVIEVGNLTVRVGTGFLQDAGTRPVTESTSLHIEHKVGSKILIDQDGNVTIEAKKDLSLLAPDGKITLEAEGDIEVKTNGAMDVKGRSP